MNSRLRVKKLHPNAILPTKAHFGDLGYDLYAAEDVEIAVSIEVEYAQYTSNKDVPPLTLVNQLKTATLVSTGIACKFPSGYGALIRDRSGMATKTGLFVVAGVIDNGYTGEIKVAFRNLGEPRTIKAGEKIAQMILIPVVDFPVEEITELGETSRGSQGFGSSGN